MQIFTVLEESFAIHFFWKGNLQNNVSLVFVFVLGVSFHDYFSGSKSGFSTVWEDSLTKQFVLEGKLAKQRFI